MRKVQSNDRLLKLLVSLFGMVGISILHFPVQAQQPGGATNPKPSIFNEPPYNRSRTTAPPPEAQPPTPSPEPSPEASPTTPSTEPSPQASPTTPSTEPSPQASPTTPSPAPSGATEPLSQNVVALAASNDSFKTLTAALKAAGLTETLSGTGPFTVFAPTDAAFAALPEGALQELLKPENKDILVKVLSYHVIPGNVTSGDIKPGEVKTVEGGTLKVQVDSAKKSVTVNDANVVQPDIKASNGVIHAIDKVIIPPDL